MKTIIIIYFIKTNTIKNISNPRVSKTPFSKWYVKSYSSYSVYYKLIEALRKNDLSDLNDNLKIMAKNLKIIENEPNKIPEEIKKYIN